jgi:short-subunit dehydrogenase
MAKLDSASTDAGPRRRAWVTGASSGIGAGFAEALARRQWDLVLVARRRERLAEMAKRLREQREIEVEALAADLTEPADLARLVEAIEAEVPDLLVNNAGVGSIGEFAGLDPARELAQIQLNVAAPVRLMRAALPGMIGRGHGSIINVSSLAGFQPMPFNATYGATKAYVLSFSEALHEELRGTGVRVQVLCPGFTRTEFQERAGVDASSVPGFAWMEVDAVVEASLQGLERGELVCIPGSANRLLAAFQRAAPHALTRRLARELTSRTIGD